MDTLKILLADDDRINLLLIERHLMIGLKKYDTFEFEIIKAYDGREALEVANSQHIDLILLDWEMPEMDGIDVLRELKLNSLTFDIPVVMVTSNTSSEHLKTAIEAGSMDFLKKPIDPIELVARVRSVVKISTAYHQIKKQNIEIVEQKEQITASINYARRMQNAMLPTDTLLSKMSKDFFVLNMPKDIVSGDFYWAKIIDDFQIFVVADCTGHGVPGAMMSMIGNNLLNEIIVNKNIFSPDLILEKLHKGVRSAFNQSENVSRDGMDISIVVIDKKTNKLNFAGAMNNMILIVNGNAMDVVANKNSIGGKQLEEERLFTNHEFDLINNNVHFYIFTDGYHDQFGGPEYKKFLIKRFKEMIINTYTLSKTEQSNYLKSEFDIWVKGYLQMDDILIMGVEL